MTTTNRDNAVKRLLLAAAAAFALISPAHAQADDCNNRTWGNTSYQADCGIMQVFKYIQSKGNSDGEKTEIIYDANGGIDAIRWERGDLLVANRIPSPGAPMAFIRTATPAGQLPACDSAEAVQILARITNTTLAGILNPTTMGANNGKNLCAANIRSPVWKTYTVEWLDQAQGRYWVQITGRLAR